MGDPIRVAIMNDYEIIVEGLRAMLEPYRDRVVVVEAEAGGLPDVNADVVLFDTFASRRNSLQRVSTLSSNSTRVP